MNPNMTSYQETVSRYTIERSFSGDRNAQDVVAALVKAHS